MAKTCTIIKAGRADTYGRPLLVGQSYTGPDDEVFSLWQSGFASVVGAPGEFLPATAIQQKVIAQINIPFLIMPGDGAANGCQFTGSGGDFTLSAAIISGIGAYLSGCYCYFSAGFGGSSLPAGWYWTEFGSDTAGTVYAETYTSGLPRRPSTRTPISAALTGRITATTNEVVALSGLDFPGKAMGKNGNLQALFSTAGSVSGSRTYRVKLNSTDVFVTGNSGSPVAETLHTLTNTDSFSQQLSSRNSPTVAGGIGYVSSTLNGTTSNFSIDTSVDCSVSVSLQSNSAVGAPVLTRILITTTYGE